MSARRFFFDMTSAFARAALASMMDWRREGEWAWAAAAAAGDDTAVPVAAGAGGDNADGAAAGKTDAAAAAAAAAAARAGVGEVLKRDIDGRSVARGAGRCALARGGVSLG